MNTSQFNLDRLRAQLKNHQDDPDKQLEIFEQFCENNQIKPEGPFPKTQQELIELQQRGMAPQLENVLETYLGINGILEEHGLSKGIDNTLDQKQRDYRGDAPQADPHLNDAKNASPDADNSNWPPKPKSSQWPPKP